MPYSDYAPAIPDNPTIISDEQMTANRNKLIFFTSSPVYPQ
ncbi:unnamed protein product [marine sediment metagenome]|uniref:Uncharacterized protein n=1 Tax=marine sediment metagenome TaxID=412755 RepID=X1VB74_9ZZZZ